MRDTRFHFATAKRSRVKRLLVITVSALSTLYICGQRVLLLVKTHMPALAPDRDDTLVLSTEAQARADSRSQSTMPAEQAVQGAYRGSCATKVQDKTHTTL